jgi:hypothetical protein
VNSLSGTSWTPTGPVTRQLTALPTHDPGTSVPVAVVAGRRSWRQAEEAP